MAFTFTDLGIDPSGATLVAAPIEQAAIDWLQTLNPDQIEGLLDVMHETGSEFEAITSYFAPRLLEQN